MDLEEKVFKYILDENKDYTKKIKYIMTDLYMRAYHNGRHTERDRLIKDGFLVINPDKEKELRQQACDPCEGCIEKTYYLKIGCKANPKECELKQKQLRALEILTHFKVYGNKE